jgi:basic amino acid/polyamine antiporter, APA family
MLGAGVFAVFAPASAAAGELLLVGLVVAAAVAWANATSSAQLAAVYPTSGGTYTYGRERLGPWWGFAAGWSFLSGKTASSAAMAMTCAAYLVPEVWQKPVAAAVVIALAAVNLFGITRTAAATRLIVVVVLFVLAAASVTMLTGGDSRLVRIGTSHTSIYGVLQSAGLLFFAFAGYARIATMGEEVKNPQRTIGRAILTALAIAVGVYLFVAGCLLYALGPTALAHSSAPVADAVRSSGAPWLVPVVSFAAAAASVGALLALLTGLGRTSLAMARAVDLPGFLARIDSKHSTPWLAEIVIASIVVALIFIADLRGALAFSSCGVLIYYFIANLAAWTQPATDRRWPRAIQIGGMVGCLTLVITLPWQGVAAGLAVLCVGLLGRALFTRA